MIPDVLKMAGSGVAEIVSLYTDSPLTTNEAETLTGLNSFQVEPNTLVSDGDSLLFEYYGTQLGDTDTQVKLTLDGTDVFDSGEVDTQEGAWILRGRILRSSLAVQKCITEFVYNGAPAAIVVVTDLTKDEALPLALTIYGGGTTIANVTLQSVALVYQAA